MKSKLLIRCTQILLYVLLAIVLIALIATSISGNFLKEFLTLSGIGSPKDLSPVLLFVFLYIEGAFALFILIELLVVLRSVPSDPFIVRNCNAFLRMGIVALISGGLFLASIAIRFTIAAMLCAIVMLLCGLFALVLASVFRKAVLYKQENDLTI